MMADLPAAAPPQQQPSEQQPAPHEATLVPHPAPPAVVPTAPTQVTSPLSMTPPLHEMTPPVHDWMTTVHLDGARIANLGRDKIHWSNEIWDHIDMAVHDECRRTSVADKFLPIHKVAHPTTTVPADSISTPADVAGVVGAFAVDEGAVTRLVEFWVEFSLTPQQVDQESQIQQAHRGHSTAVTLATRAANLLTRAEDMILFQGASAFDTQFFKDNVRSRGTPTDFGLLDIIPDGATSSVPALPPDQVIKVNNNGTPQVYAENTFSAVAKGYGTLNNKGQYGLYALTLQTIPYADTYAPLANTLILTADRIKPLMTAGFYGSGTLVSNPDKEPRFTGSLVSVGGNTMDLVVGLGATTAYMQQDVDGNYRFRVLERIALRLKDISAVIRLEFE